MKMNTQMLPEWNKLQEVQILDISTHVSYIQIEIMSQRFEAHSSNGS